MFRSIGAVADTVEGGGSGGDGEHAQQTSTAVSMVAGDVMALRSLCVSCEDEGETKVLLTKIPFFRDVILMAFDCEHCGFRNSEVQSAEIQEKGCKFEVTVSSVKVCVLVPPRLSSDGMITVPLQGCVLASMPPLCIVSAGAFRKSFGLDVSAAGALAASPEEGWKGVLHSFAIL